MSYVCFDKNGKKQARVSIQLRYKPKHILIPNKILIYLIPNPNSIYKIALFQKPNIYIYKPILYQIAILF